MKSFIIEVIKLCGILGLIGLLILSCVTYYGYNKVIENTNMVEVVNQVKQQPKYTPLAKTNEIFLEAIVAVEDRRFYQHGAIDVVGLTRAFIANVLKGGIVQGGSTITQQLAKNLFLTNERTIMRKIKELFLAYELEKNYSKEEILELYVNVIYYGDGNTGIGEASENYFNKKASELTFDEATLLAGLPQAPSRYALTNHYDRAKKRQEVVITAYNRQKNSPISKEVVHSKIEPINNYLRTKSSITIFHE